jgi:Uma2 family endonuclease
METALTSEIWAEQWQYYANNPIQMAPVLPLTQDQFFDLCQQNRKLRLERTANGELILMPPAGGDSSSQSLSIAAQLYAWSKRIGKGRVFDSSAGFILPNGANRSPDAAWLTDEQLATITPEQMRKFPPVCPYFLVESLSPSDSLTQTQAKMEEYLANGTKLGWLIDPSKNQVHVYRPGQPVQVLDNPQTLAGDPELPGFVLDLEPVWRP